MVGPLGPRLRWSLYAAGLVSVSFSVLLLVAPAARALPGAARIAQAIDVFVQASPAPVPSPAPSATPRDTFFDKPIFFGTEPTAAPTVAPTPFALPKRRGPRIVLGLSGNASAGEALTNSTHVGANGVLSNSLGLQASLERRGEASDFRMSLPGSLNAHGTTIGNASADLVTRRGVASYGYFPLGPLGTLPLATIDRAYSLTTPLRGGGELVVFGGPALLENARFFHTAGVRLRRGLRGGVGTVEAFDGRASSGGGTMQALVAGVASRPGRLAGTAEFGLERLRGLGDVADGSAFAYQLRADYAPRLGDFSFSRRVVTDRFIGTGGAGGRPENLSQVGLISRYRGTDLSVQTSFDTLLSTPAQGASYDLRHGLSIGRRIGVGQASVSFADARSINASGTTWSGSGTQNFALLVAGATVIETLQAARTTANTTGPSASITYGLDVLRPTKLFGLEARLSQTNQTGSGQSGRATNGVFGISRISGAYVFGLTDSIARTQSAGLDQLTNSTTASFGRRLFGGVFVQAQYGLQSTRSRSTPQLNGTSALFNVSLGAPFAIGNGLAGGKSDPRAPATIAGIVVNDGIDPLAAGTLGAGVPDILVTLDGLESQRTDVLGRFLFRFVPPGRHEVRIEPAALPRGYTADFPFLNVTIAGGQSSQVSLGVSAKTGAIAGKIVGTNTSGNDVPIENAVVRLDGTRVERSGPLGNFGFGRLQSGPHTIEVVDSSLPAEVQLLERSQKVTTKAGTTTAVVFRSAPLGSIGGRVVAQNAGKDVPDGPIANAYVIANPGDRAAITSDDGTYTIDNLPAGTYTLSVDPETLPQDTDATEGARTIELHPGERLEGTFFTIGEKLRAIDFTFSGNSAAKVPVLSLAISSAHLPPGGSTPVTARSSVAESQLVLHAFHSDFPLIRSPGSDIYRGRLVVPITERSGSSIATVTTSSAKGVSASASIDVDSRLPLVRIESDPRRPSVGQYVRVRMRVFAEVAPGDPIVWQDGSTTKLGAIQPGRIFVFTQKIGALPYHGILRTKTLPIAITLGL